MADTDENVRFESTGVEAGRQGVDTHLGELYAWKSIVSMLKPLIQKASYCKVHTEYDGKPSHDRIEPKLALLLENPRPLIIAQDDYKDCRQNKGNQISR